MKNIIILIVFILISCKTEQKSEKVTQSEQSTLLQKKEKEPIEKGASNYTELDSIWVDRIFKNTPLTSENGKLYQGYKSKVYGMTSDSINNKKLNTYIKKVGIEDGSLSEIYVVLLSENGEELYDLKWIGNNGQVAECEMNTEFHSIENGLIANYSFNCFDGYDETLDKEFMVDKITISKIIVEQNSLIIKRDTLTKKNAIN
ncbi:MAG: hypothetical protein COB60_04270 [Flavobacteriaceae bacterium]|nr:MAG: hypothetical protein COB60_04270 [Flavobacteriaceae bacterium]